MTPVRFVWTMAALTYDSKNDRVVRVDVSVDDKGRRWRSYDCGPDELVESPEEPDEPNTP